ncbi:MAG: decaprenyl-phosphate phosphoribosyltransferase [Candidatus Eisenbacteria bacterium]|nr:decaprenyl-phosphate phosphoribosyltransferase [Candidatus Eisenbacteria bacterium]
MILALIEELRPKQWTKNLLLFAGVLFSQQMGEPGLALRAALGFVTFSLLSGTVYLLNDLKDVEADRLHPRKRRRPIAAGRLPATVAAAALVPLLALAAVLSVRLGAPFTAVAAIYLVMNLAYSMGLRDRVLLDVFVIALGFVLRAIAGVELLRPVSPGTEISPWLLVCTFFGALFLALAKRRRELTNAGDGAGQRRAVLAHYTPALLDGLVLVSAAASIMGYALYTIWPETVRKFGTGDLLYTVPFVTYGIFRYLYLVRSSEVSEDPSQLLLTDRPLAACVLLCLAAVGFILYRGG